MIEPFEFDEDTSRYDFEDRQDEPEDHHDADREGWEDDVYDQELAQDMILERQELEDFEQVDEYFGGCYDDF